MCIPSLLISKIRKFIFFSRESAGGDGDMSATMADDEDEDNEPMSRDSRSEPDEEQSSKK